MELLLVVPAYADERQRVADEHRLDTLIERRRAAQRWQDVDLENPGLESGVDEDVEAVQLEAVQPIGGVLL